MQVPSLQFFLGVFSYCFMYARGKLFAKAHKNYFLMSFLRLRKNKSLMARLAHITFPCPAPPPAEMHNFGEKNHSPSSPVPETHWGGCHWAAGSRAAGDCPGALSQSSARAPTAPSHCPGTLRGAHFCPARGAGVFKKSIPAVRSTQALPGGAGKRRQPQRLRARHRVRTALPVKKSKTAATEPLPKHSSKAKRLRT